MDFPLRILVVACVIGGVVVIGFMIRADRAFTKYMDQFDEPSGGPLHMDYKRKDKQALRVYIVYSILALLTPVWYVIIEKLING